LTSNKSLLKSNFSISDTGYLQDNFRGNARMQVEQTKHSQTVIDSLTRVFLHTD